MKSAINWHCILHSTFKDKDRKSKKIKDLLIQAISCIFPLIWDIYIAGGFFTSWATREALIWDNLE